MSELTTSAKNSDFIASSPTHGTWKKVSIALAVAIVVAWYFWGGSASNPSNQHASMAGGIPEVTGGSETVGTRSSEAEQRKLLVGKWETNRSGRRELTVNADGTARMDVTIENTFAKMLLGGQIVLDLDWKIENGVLTLITTGGEPSSKVDLMTSMYGKERTQKIIELNETTLHHPDDEPGGEDHIWKRIPN